MCFLEIWQTCKSAASPYTSPRIKEFNDAAIIFPPTPTMSEPDSHEGAYFISPDHLALVLLRNRDRRHASVLPPSLNPIALPWDSGNEKDHHPQRATSPIDCSAPPPNTTNEKAQVRLIGTSPSVGNAPWRITCGPGSRKVCNCDAAHGISRLNWSEFHEGGVGFRQQGHV